MESLLDSMTIPLSRPYIIDGTEYKEMVMYEPKLRDKILFSKDKGDFEEKTARMMARLLNVDEKSLYDLPACDYAKLENAFNELVKDPSERSEIS
ncbi:phage tail assembly protein [Salmonella enterica subsp. enterica serovar Isangi]|nr:phage tail assembly protein [Salmonella enterica subsp. enterica serovar Ituri]EHC7797967.1 phage tail assembly protein [Salmonella enterica subsp. enterica serovar Isangi]EHD2000949.1 phage tail assembly protein [Salmonella enterica subsp. enterica serovar Isangi]EHD2010309.1 phage tail assembly protein [Salmonella enterica subsp. enterica serovar Isangi]EHD2085069.1 phage tail assembly protein [Salmonella enterica subsp. enterica serovar Isangi]